MGKRWEIFASWHRDESFWRDVYTRTASALLTAAVLVGLAALAGVIAVEWVIALVVPVAFTSVMMSLREWAEGSKVSDSRDD